MKSLSVSQARRLTIFALKTALYDTAQTAWIDSTPVGLGSWAGARFNAPKAIIERTDQAKLAC
ncbi:MAG: hypothetical protein B7Y07_05865 [Halothiobacillus sp. 24-54-40]|nr:MAG: hypothetical protein B7Y58_06145 [Halothiobacillus sp. 35-54-62]OYZ87020.1 MAG: hypothetical protein B7Y07_05865 [Halothiobacillus sp. 24-54-40]OZA80392.1 MAG: hypothetical protein B7X64_05980 [Halothiobacillus sp. 39-53-45]